MGEIQKIRPDRCMACKFPTGELIPVGWKRRESIEIMKSENLWVCHLCHASTCWETVEYPEPLDIKQRQIVCFVGNVLLSEMNQMEVRAIERASAFAGTLERLMTVLEKGVTIQGIDIPHEGERP